MVIVTAPFVETARAMAASWGVPTYKFLVTSHPIANLGEAELDAKADGLTRQVVSFLEEGQAGLK